MHKHVQMKHTIVQSEWSGDTARKISLHISKILAYPQNIPKIDTTLLLFYVDTRKILKAIRGSGYRFVPKGGMFPTETIMLVVRSSGL